jgi:outer membrane protein assembly factor BamD (BamD/ComL family)
MRYNIIAFFILIATVLSAWIASAEEITTQGVATKSADELWTEAERAYREGEFAEAVVAYEAIIAQGMESAELYYNLGNAYFKQNNLGRSILFYNRAQLLNPSDEDVRHNLVYARTKTKDNIQQLPAFFFVLPIRPLLRTPDLCRASKLLWQRYSGESVRFRVP